MTAKNLLLAIVLGALLAVAFLLFSRDSTPPALKSGLILPTQNTLPALSLLDQDGAAVSNDSFRGQWDLMFFGFTRCPDICPATLQILATAQERLREKGHPTIPRIVLVSVDPDRDTPETMKQYLSHFGAGHLGVTGKIQDIQTLTSALGIYFAKQETDAPNYSVDHSAAVLLIDEDAKFHALFGGPHTVDDLVHDIPLITND